MHNMPNIILGYHGYFNYEDLIQKLIVHYHFGKKFKET